MTICITENDLCRLGLRGRNLGNAETFSTADPFDPSNAQRLSLSKLFNDITTSPIKRDVTCLLNGKKGSGKSYMTIAIGYYCSVRRAETLGGQPSDYFNIDTLGIMLPEEIFKLQQIKDKYLIKGFDDASPAVNSRSSMTKTNRDSNDINVTDRTNHQIKIYSTPDQSFMDTVLRTLADYFGVVDQNIPLKRRGIGTVRMMETDRNVRTGKRYYTYPHHWNKKVVRFLIAGPTPFAPPALKRLYEEYDLKRETNADILNQRIAERQNGTKPENETMGENPRTMRARKNAEAKQLQYDELILQGYTHKEAVRELRISRDCVKNWTASGWFCPIS